MTPADTLGATWSCACGKTHRVAVREVVYADGALQTVPALLTRLLPSARRLALVADRRTYAAAGHACEDALRRAGGWTLSRRMIPDPPHGDPVCDDLTRDALRRNLPAADVLLAVGSGVVSDLVKWMAADTGVPYVVVATAASMNGYASNNIAPTIRGVKRVLDGTVPLAVVAEPAVIAGAPYALTAAGLGDVLAKPVSIADWQLNHLLFDEYYCPVCAQLIRDLEPAYRDRPEALRAREPAALAGLFQALVYSGVSMTMAGTSFPASGGEHMISHALDMVALERGHAHDLHGRQVGVGTLFACALYERLLALEAPVFRVVTEPTDSAYWRALTPVVEEEHAKKRLKAARAVERLCKPGVWENARVVLRPFTRPAAEIKRCLRAAGAAHRLEDIGCAREAFLEAVGHAHQMRERYTILDLARAAGLLPAAAEAIVEKWLLA